MGLLLFRVFKMAATAASAALLLASACSDGESATLEPCTPLDTQASAPVELGEVLGIGRSEDGTIYLVDKRGSDLRVFVSDGGVLQRYVVDGSGESTTRDSNSVSVTVRSLDLSLKISVDAAGDVRMGVCYSAAERDCEIGEGTEQGEELELLDEKDIEELPLRNLSSTMTIEYWAESEDGRLLLVTRPSNDWDYEDFQLFFGPSERVDERAVTSVVRQRDGGTTTIQFRAGGSAIAYAIAYFPTPSRDEDSTLSLDGNGQKLTLLSSNPATSNAAFYCR